MSPKKHQMHRTIKSKKKRIRKKHNIILAGKDIPAKFEYTKHNEGIRAVRNFPNGYGISIIKNMFSYGGRQGLFEIAVLQNGDLCYSTHITNDVVGWLTPAAVAHYIQLVKEL